MKTVYVIIREDRNGFYKLDTGRVCEYSTRGAAQEYIDKHLFKTGYSVLPLTVAGQSVVRCDDGTEGSAGSKEEGSKGTTSIGCVVLGDPITFNTKTFDVASIDEFDDETSVVKDMEGRSYWFDEDGFADIDGSIMELVMFEANMTAEYLRAETYEMMCERVYREEGKN